jgi:hypothetical protein
VVDKPYADALDGLKQGRCAETRPVVTRNMSMYNQRAEELGIYRRDNPNVEICPGSRRKPGRRVCGLMQSTIKSHGLWRPTKKFKSVVKSNKESLGFLMINLSGF